MLTILHCGSISTKESLNRAKAIVSQNKKYAILRDHTFSKIRSALEAELNIYTGKACTVIEVSVKSKLHLGKLRG
jgi:hypothetical protein